MSSVDSIRARIEELNKQSAYLNSQRSQNIGKRDALSQQCEKLLASYESEYNVKLTPDNLDAEIQRVLADKEVEINTLGSAITAITQGNYSEAYSILGLTTEDNVPVTILDEVLETPPVSNTLSGADELLASSSVDEVVETPSVTPNPIIDLSDIPASAPAEVVPSPAPAKQVEDIAPPTPFPMMAGFSKPLTPPPAQPVQPKQPEPPKQTAEKGKSNLNSFAAIFGGTQFNNE